MNAPFMPSGKVTCPYASPMAQASQTSPSGMYCTPHISHKPSYFLSLINGAGYMVTFANSTCTICDTVHKTIGLFPKWEGLYKVDTYLRDSASVSSSDTSLSIEDAHQLLGHILPDAIKQLCKERLITGFTLNHNTKIAACDSCTYAKLTLKKYI